MQTFLTEKYNKEIEGRGVCPKCKIWGCGVKGCDCEIGYCQTCKLQWMKCEKHGWVVDYFNDKCNIKCGRCENKIIDKFKSLSSNLSNNFNVWANYFFIKIGQII